MDEMSARYKVVAGSQSAHCCFCFTVVDSSRPFFIGQKQWVDADGTPEFEALCECFNVDDARRIADALNRAQTAASL